MGITMPSWIYDGRIITEMSDMPEGTFGFIYEVTHTPTGRKYIGKKVLYFNRTLPPLTDQKRKRKIVKESDWKTYFGSHAEIVDLIKEGKQEEFTKQILCFVRSKKLLTYYETKYLFIKEVLEYRNNYINDNVLGKFYRKDFITPDTDD